MIKPIYVILFLFGFAKAACGQDMTDVTVSDVLQEKHSTYDTAHMVHQYASKRVDYVKEDGKRIRRIRFDYRIKIYDTLGVQQSIIRVPQYSDDRFYITKAQTYEISNGKLVTRFFDKDEIHDENFRGTYGFKNVSFPDLKAGMIIDLSFEIRSSYVLYNGWFFQQGFPIDISKYEVTIPEDHYDIPVVTGLHPIQFSSKKRRVLSRRGIFYAYSAVNIPPHHPPSHILNKSDYVLKLSFKRLFNKANPEINTVHASWNDVGKYTMRRKGISNYLNADLDQFNPFLERIAPYSESIRMDSIFHFVRNSYNWDGTIGGGPTYEIDEILQSGIGSMAELNLLLINLLRKSDIKTDFLITKARGFGVFNPNVASTDQLSYILARVHINKEIILLDATSKFAHPGTLPLRGLNVVGLVSTEFGGKLVPIENPNLNKRQMTVDYHLDLDKTMLIGTGLSKYYGFTALKYREENVMQDLNPYKVMNLAKFNKAEKDTLVKEPEVPLDSIEVVETRNLEDTDKPVFLKFHEYKKSCVTRMDSVIHIDCNFGHGIIENSFTANSRECPVFFNAKKDYLYVIKFNIPSGYKIASLPENLHLSLPDNMGQYILDISESEIDKTPTILVRLDLKLNRDIFLPDVYLELHEFYKRLMQKQNEKIILVKE